MAIAATASPTDARHPHPVRTEAASLGAARPTVSGHGDRRQGHRPSLPGTRGVRDAGQVCWVHEGGEPFRLSIVRYNWSKGSPSIVRYNRPKKFFSSDCTIQSAQKVFFKRLYDTIGPKSFFHVIVRYNEPKGSLAIVRYNGHKGGLAIVSYNRPRQRPSSPFRF